MNEPLPGHQQPEWVKEELKRSKAAAAEAERAEAALVCLVATQGVVDDAVKIIKPAITADELRKMRDVTHHERYRRLQQEHSAEVVATVTQTARRVAEAAAEVELIAIGQAKERLADNKDADPAKTAAALSSVKAKNIEKMVQLESRPKDENVERSLATVIGTMVRGGFLEPVDGVFLDNLVSNE